MVSQIHCSLADAISDYKEIAGETDVSLSFNLGGTNSDIDLRAAEYFHDSKQDIVWSTDEDKTLVARFDGKHLMKDSQEVYFRRPSQNPKKFTNFMMGPSCESQGSSGKLSIKNSNEEEYFNCNLVFLVLQTVSMTLRFQKQVRFLWTP